jgi:hypothetical protein
MEMDDLSGLSEIMPGIVEVTVIPMGANSVRSSGVLVRAAEQRPVSADQRAAAGIELEVEATRWHLWVATFSAPIPIIRGQCLIREADGTEWIVALANLEMMKTRWACDCVRNYEQPS